MIATIRLQNFRSYADASFDFDDGVNIIVGPNASGKTNLLEAILVLARGGSYRVKDADLLQFNAPWSRLDATLTSGSQRTIKLVTEPAPAKTYELDGKTYKRLTLNHALPIVLFEPNHLQLLSGGPERRRTYLDDVLEQTLTGYGTLRRNYRRTLAQRNALLKTPGAVSQLFPWNVRLSQLGGQIVRARTELVDSLQKALPALYEDLSHAKTSIRVQYGSPWDPNAYESNLLKRLESTVQLDQQRGFTGSGPHREDLLVYFNDHLAQESASRGESRTLVLALKIIELQLLASARDVTPILLLDDVFSELDAARRRALTEHLSHYQTFITTTDADVVVHEFTKTSKLIPISQ